MKYTKLLETSIKYIRPLSKISKLIKDISEHSKDINITSIDIQNNADNPIATIEETSDIKTKQNISNYNDAILSDKDIKNYQSEYNNILDKITNKQTRKNIDINGVYKSDNWSLPTFNPIFNESMDPSRIHWQEKWDQEDIKETIYEHSMFTWGTSDAGKDAILLKNAKGIYLYDENGKEYIDWTSEAVCVNLGHTVPIEILKAVTNQLESIPFTYQSLGIYEYRARLAQLLAEITPADINGFLFTLTGSESNEAAVRMARNYTGKYKIFSRYRGYHGGSSAMLTATGDSRRWNAEAGISGFVKQFDPYPYTFTFGDTEEAITFNCLRLLEEQILQEGPHTIAAIMSESVLGASGAVQPPVGFMEGLRSLCDKYNILLILDEVMTGFGRTGKMFGFQNYSGVVPDIFTFAKGVSSAYLPLGGVAVRKNIQDYFRTNPLGWGSTYSSHPVVVACGQETLKYLINNKIINHVKNMEIIMIEEMGKIKNKHRCIKNARIKGLFGAFDLINKEGNLYPKSHEPQPEVILKFKKRLKENGIIGLFRMPTLLCAPPLIIKKHEIKSAFEKIDDALNILD